VFYTSNGNSPGETSRMSNFPFMARYGWRYTTVVDEVDGLYQILVLSTPIFKNT
jgi:hypothetical protein